MMKDTMYQIREASTTYTECTEHDVESLIGDLSRITALADGALEEVDLKYGYIDEQFTTDLLRGCARCHKDHENMVWRPLQYPIEDPDGTHWTHWAPCPTNDQPVLMRATS